MVVGKVYTRQELIDKLLLFEMENERIPQRDDIASTRGYPPIKQYYREFGSFTNALAATPFVTGKVIIYTRDILISEALRYEGEFGKVPSYSDMQNVEGFPPVSTYLKEFRGKWKNVLNEVPFKNQDEVKKREVKIYTDDELKGFLLKRAEEIDRIPEISDLDVSLGYPCADVYRLRFGSWKEIKKEVFYNKEWLKPYLIKVKEKLGRLPRIRDMREYKGFISETVFIEAYGSWDNAIEETFYTEEYVNQAFLQFEKDNGRKPIITDFQHAKGQIPYHRVEKIYGSWNDATYDTPFETTIDHSFFSLENMNPRKWYIVSYAVGDGNVSDTGCFNIRASEIDKENLYNMYKYMNLDTKFRFDVKGEGLQNSYSISKTSPRWNKDVAEYGLVPRKTGKEYIPLEYLETTEDEAAFCRGIFDSDGGIHYRPCGTIYITVGDTKGTTFDPVFFICSASKILCEDYAYILKRKCGIICNVLKHHTIFRIQIIGKEKCQKIYNFLYGHDNFFIKRKKERFEKLLNGTFDLETDVY